MPPSTPDAAARFIESLGLATEEEGLPRTAGRLMAYLLLAPEPVTFNDIVRDLGVSRGGAAITNRVPRRRTRAWTGYLPISSAFRRGGHRSPTESVGETVRVGDYAAWPARWPFRFA